MHVRSRVSDCHPRDLRVFFFFSFRFSIFVSSLFVLPFVFRFFILSFILSSFLSSLPLQNRLSGTGSDFMQEQISGEEEKGKNEMELRRFLRVSLGVDRLTLNQGC